MNNKNVSVLVVEDQEDISALIDMNLKALDFQVTRSLDGSEGLELALHNDFDLIILDIMLPGVDGLQICQAIRAKGNITPILMLTARKSEADRVLGLEVGADDYLTKPFSVLELRARVKALLRRVSLVAEQYAKGQDERSQDEDREATLRHGPHGELTINPQRREVIKGDESIQLTSKEFDLLLYMASHPGHVFTREQLLDAVWGYQHSGYEHTVNSHINRLRAKLEADPAKPNYVITVWGVGYKFNG